MKEVPADGTGVGQTAVLRLTWVRDRLAHVLEHELRGNVVSDAYLAALAIEHGLEVCSDDSDFARFSEVRWTNPVARDSGATGGNGLRTL